MKRKSLGIGYFYAIASGVICGITPIIFQKVLSQEPIPRATALFIKLITMSIILLPFTLPKLKKAQLPKRFGGNLLVSAILYVGTLVFLYESYEFIPTGIGATLHYTFPLFTMLISFLFFRFRCSKQSVLAMLLSLIGMFLLSSGSLSSGNAYIGIILSIGSAIIYSIYYLWMERTKLVSIDTTVFIPFKTCLSAVLLFVYILVTNQLTFSVSFEAVLWLALSGAFTLLASFCVILAIRYIGSVYTSILGSLEPIVCAVAGTIFLGEHLSFKNGIGVVLVLIATILVTLNKQKNKND